MRSADDVTAFSKTNASMNSESVVIRSVGKGVRAYNLAVGRRSVGSDLEFCRSCVHFHGRCSWNSFQSGNANDV